MGASHNVVIVGPGNIASHRHIPALKRSGRARVIGVVDVDKECALRGGAAVPHPARRPHAGRSWVDDADVVIVSTPPMLHARLSCDALRRGKHVLQEKPTGLTVAEGERDPPGRGGVRPCLRRRAQLPVRPLHAQAAAAAGGGAARRGDQHQRLPVQQPASAPARVVGGTAARALLRRVAALLLFVPRVRWARGDHRCGGQGVAAQAGDAAPRDRAPGHRGGPGLSLLQLRVQRLGVVLHPHLREGCRDHRHLQGPAHRLARRTALTLRPT